MNKEHKLRNAIIFATMIIAAISFLYPFLFMLINAFKTKTDYMTNKFWLPSGGYSLDNLRAMISQFHILSYFKNTMIVSLGSVFAILALSVFASYAFAKCDFKGRGLVYLLIVSTMFIPAQTTMIPMYSLYAKMGLVNNYLSVIINYMATGIPGTVLLLTANFRSIPKEMLEAARIDGCSFSRIVCSIVVPVGMPAIAISFIFSFLAYWNDLFTPMILLQKTEVKTVIVALTGLVQRYANDPTYQMAGLLLSVIPSLIIFFMFQKYIVKGVTMGSIK